MDYVELHCHSAYSLLDGTSAPANLVTRAADLGMDALALTDRDGVYGAVRFVKACSAAGIRPVLGVDLALPATGVARPDFRRGGIGQRRSPARGGAFVDPDRPRITVLAAGRAGWGALCRLITATHLAGASQPLLTAATGG